MLGWGFVILQERDTGKGEDKVLLLPGCAGNHVAPRMGATAQAALKVPPLGIVPCWSPEEDGSSALPRLCAIHCPPGTAAPCSTGGDPMLAFSLLS